MASKKLIKTLLILEKMEKEHAQSLLLEKNTLEQDCLFLEKEKMIAQEHLLQERSSEAEITAFATFPNFEKALLDKITEIKHEIEHKSHELVYVQEDLLTVHRTLKGWEVLRQQLEEREKKEELKRDQALLDEIGQQRHTQNHPK